jgi:hypothetical protein
MTIGAKDLIAVVVLLLAFALLAPYVLHNQTPPDVILLISAPAITGVLAYYFGAHNGNITGLAASAVQISNMAAQLANQALEKRTATIAVPVAGTLAVVPVAAPTGEPSPPTG